MDFGVVLQCNPPASRVVELAVSAENRGFSHVWTFDSHVLWQEPYVIYSQILSATRTVTVGPMVTNPLTRDNSVTASTYATLNSMFGNRTVCGIGRGDSAVRVTSGKPCSVAELGAAVQVIRELGNGRSVEINGATVQFPWARRSELEVYGAGYGPRMLDLIGRQTDGVILQIADPLIVEWMVGRVKRAAEAAGRDPAAVKVVVAAPAYVGTDVAHQRDQCRWFGGMVGNHVADLVARYGGDGAGVPRALTDYIEHRCGYDYNQHGKAGNTHADFVPDGIIDRFCLLGTPDQHVSRLQELSDLGVDQFAAYLQHDGIDATLTAYGDHVIPALQPQLSARL
ncbi:methylenetetrahydromethanopterin reductase [Mycolicibacterium canariasense]|uniref:Methylenetetrahydromethanopterin reductase n=1 Tax=Mycolicibacterium canariasense TaxID=228230 RepID=A0A100WGR0_MYCCR|nr:TIGR03842 family LLM class F420-dependent oxidoreductase [Mycolicibacterium canariasense]MCV7211758.1 TIGR03842 family LLM class F420-dependent oxidoreductase [Mycolicibacterium canariasense]ORV08172.1 LLM class F420-dependent oxidoreductase [Mycolicibacterium canariasense]GAS98287.1 methylenetetrahydromethanopterin reductase [Mycolicibacterium canariasense]